MSYSTSGVLGVDPAQIYTVNSTTPDVPGAPFTPGQRSELQKNGEVLFLQNVETTANTVGDVMVVNAVEATATKMTTTNGLRGFQVGVALSAVPGTTGNIKGYGWYQIKGYCPAISVLASAVANVRLNTTATAGALDDDGTATTKQVQGIYLSTTRGGTAGTAPGVLDYPFVDVTL